MKNNQHHKGTLFERERTANPDSGPVICLGMTFPNDKERQAHLFGILREKLKDPELRKIEGFPIGSDEDILAFSDRPYYTAYLNSFIENFIKQLRQTLRSEQAIQPRTIHYVGIGSTNEHE
ncbi:hypothetical protein MASR1M66_18330 [Aminivibrio sp.]